MKKWEEKAHKGDYTNAIAAFIAEHSSVTFSELQAALSPYMEVQGNLSIEAPGYPNLIVWLGMSEELCKLIGDLIKSHTIGFTPTPSLTYLTEGIIPTIPIANTVRHYKEPHWIPTVLYSKKKAEQ